MLLCALVAVVAVPAAQAAYPGKNGKVVALSPDHEIVLIDPETEAVESIGGADLPSYAVSSPDGSGIAYVSPETSGPR